MKRDTAQAEDGAFPDGDPGTHNRARREPGLRLDSDRPDYQIEARPTPIMIAGAQVDGLGQAAMIANLDLSQIVYPDVLPDPGVIADFQAPRELDPHAWLDRDMPTDSGTEDSQEPHAQP